MQQTKKEEPCWICGKLKGQPPNRCPGHYDMQQTKLDKRIRALTPWQQETYKLAWKCGASRDKDAGIELEKRKQERPKEYEKAIEVWEAICFEVMN